MSQCSQAYTQTADESAAVAWEICFDWYTLMNQVGQCVCSGGGKFNERKIEFKRSGGIQPNKIGDSNFPFFSVENLQESYCLITSQGSTSISSQN